MDLGLQGGFLGFWEIDSTFVFILILAASRIRLDRDMITCDVEVGTGLAHSVPMYLTYIYVQMTNLPEMQNL